MIVVEVVIVIAGPSWSRWPTGPPTLVLAQVATSGKIPDFLYIVADIQTLSAKASILNQLKDC